MTPTLIDLAFVGGLLAFLAIVRYGQSILEEFEQSIPIPIALGVFAGLALGLSILGGQL